MEARRDPGYVAGLPARTGSPSVCRGEVKPQQTTVQEPRLFSASRIAKISKAEAAGSPPEQHGRERHCGEQQAARFGNTHGGRRCRAGYDRTHYIAVRVQLINKEREVSRGGSSRENDVDAERAR